MMTASRSVLLAFISLFLLGVSQPLSAQTILGRARDGEGKTPLRNIEIALVSDSGAPNVILARTTTDSGGMFIIDAPSSGTYRLLFNVPDAPMLSAPIPLKADSEPIQREFRVDIASVREYFEVEVERPVRQIPGLAAPRYPEGLRGAGIEGEVLAQFVVDTMGKPEMRTFKTLKSTHPEFTQEVRSALPRMEFYPAEFRGRKVRQVVQMPFLFCLNGGPPPRVRPDTSKYFWVIPVRPAGCASTP